MAANLITASTPATLVAGQIVACSRAFTSPIGAHFLAGDQFEVELVGRSTRLRSLRGGCVVWIQGSTTDAPFLTN